MASVYSRAMALASGVAGGPAPTPDQMDTMQQLIGQVAFTEGATNAFLTGAGMIWLGTLIVVTLMNVKHEEMATDGPEVAVAA